MLRSERHPRPTQPAPRRQWGTRAAALSTLTLIGAGCGSGATTSKAAGPGSGQPARPSITITLRDGGIASPATITGGLVDVTLVAQPGQQAHHLAFLRLHDGVTADQLRAASGPQAASLVDYEGGNGQLAPGQRATLTLALDPGRYEIVDIPDGPVVAAAETTVTAAPGHQGEPSAKGTVTLGPGMAISLAAGFDGTGEWRFNNAATAETHEAGLLKLSPGKTAQDVITWAQSFQGPPPFDYIGGFGALGAGRHGWMDLGTHLEPGHYALACFFPGEDGKPHVAMGMIAPFTVR